MDGRKMFVGYDGGEWPSDGRPEYLLCTQYLWTLDRGVIT